MITDEMVVEAAWEVYADQYREGATLSDISRRSGAPRTRVTATLQRLGAYDGSRGKGRARKDRCKRGHDMSVHGREIKNRKGGRYCGECHRLRAAGMI